MGKLSRDFLEQCVSGNGCTNELVVLPTDGDVGFDEYFEFKVKEVIKSKRIFSPEEQNKLLLTYPHPESKELNIFDKFFESPSIVAKNHEFEGCFGIDVTDYIGKTEDEHFQRLLTYISTNTSAVYMIIIFSNNKNEIKAMSDILNQHSEYRLVDISLPDVDNLVEYTVSQIRDFSAHVKKPIYTYLKEYYSNNGCGYDTADYLVRCLKLNDFSGEIDDMKNIVEKMNSGKKASGSSLGFGY